MLTDVPGMLTRAGLYPHSQPTAAVIHDKSVSRQFIWFDFFFFSKKTIVSLFVFYIEY